MQTDKSIMFPTKIAALVVKIAVSIMSGVLHQSKYQCLIESETRSCYSNLKPRLYFFANAQLSSSKVRAKFNLFAL